MRIYGNRPLKTLPGQATRPTASRVREAVFNIWQGQIVGCRWLDLCAGNGSMGAEALCRGASFVAGIEQNAKACAIIRENWQKVANSTQEYQVLRGDVRQMIRKLTAFDFIYFDPPYASDLYQPVLEAIASQSLLLPTGELAVEHSPTAESFLTIPGLEICREKLYGNTAVTFYQVVETPELSEQASE